MSIAPKVSDAVYTFLLSHGVAETLKHYSEGEIREAAKRHHLWLPSRALDETDGERVQRKKSERAARKNYVPGLQRYREERNLRRAAAKYAREVVRYRRRVTLLQDDADLRERLEQERRRLQREYQRLERLEQERKLFGQRRTKAREKRALQLSRKALARKSEIAAEEREIVGSRRVHWSRLDAEQREPLFVQYASDYQLCANLNLPTLLDIIEDLARPWAELTNALHANSEEYPLGIGPRSHNWDRHPDNFNAQLAQLDEIDQELARLYATDGVPEQYLNSRTVQIVDDDWRGLLIQCIAYGI